MILERYDIVNNDNIQSLVKAEWDTIRYPQRPLVPGWSSMNNRFTKDCCGILFNKGTAFASNGHFLMKVRTDEHMFDDSVKHMFFLYQDNNDAECILENVNPFADKFGVTTDAFFDACGVWRPYNIKLRIDDFMGLADDVVPTVRDRRKYSLQLGHFGDGQLGVRFEPRNHEPFSRVLPMYGKPVGEFPGISVNLSYFTKILHIVADWYYVVDICFSDEPDDYIVIKAKNPHDDKPDIRFLLGQFSY